MDRIVWSQQAAADLEQIVQFISRDSPHYASMVAQKIFDAIDNVALFPDAGRPVPETPTDDLRQQTVGNYRIIYRKNDDAMQIITIFHGSRKLR